MEEEEEKEMLPLDLIYEVLTWCDANALASEQEVAQYFINLHLQRPKTIRGFFQTLCNGAYYNVSFLTPKFLSPTLFSLDFLPKNVKIEASTGSQTDHSLLCVNRVS